MTIGRAVVDEGDWDRVRRYELQYEDGGTWKTIAEGKTLGPKKTLESKPLKAQHFRLSILDANEVPAILEFELYGGEGSDGGLVDKGQ
jgi:alpha-L-fucosidase